MRYHMILIAALLLGVLIFEGCGGGDSSVTEPQMVAPAPRAGAIRVLPAQEQGDLWGDMDRNGQSSVGDAIKILRIVVGLDSENPLADANNNGGADVGDAIKVLRCVVGLDDWPIGHYGGGGSVDVSGAMAAPQPTSPSSVTPEGPGDTAVGLLETWERDLPEDASSLTDMLTEFTNLVNSNRNSPAGQLGLSVALVAAGSENAADELGYDIFPEVGVQSVASLALSDKYSASRAINKAVDIALFRPWQRQKTGVYPQGQIPDTFYTTEEVQQIIRDNILPVLNDAIARLDILSQAPAGTVLVTYIDPDDGEIYKLYPADFDLLIAGLDLVKAFMLQLVAYDLDTGNYDWELDLWERDTNGDDILTVAEYAPADPFLNLLSAQDMNDAGDAIQDALQRLMDALDNRVSGDPDEVINRLIEDESASDIQDVRDMVQKALNIFSGAVNMDVQYAHYNWDTGQWSGAGTETMQINLSRIWSNPLADVKDLLPTVHIIDKVNEHYKINYGDWPDPTMNGVFPDAQGMKDLWDADYEYLEVIYSDLEIEINDDYPFGESPPFP